MHSKSPAASLRGFSFPGIGWITGAHPDSVLSAHLRPVPKGRVICLAAGKAAAAMAAAAERHYLDALELDPARLSGIATTRHGPGVPTRRIKVIEAGHP